MEDNLETVKRRDFIRKATLAAGAAGVLSACESPQNNASPSTRSAHRFQWKMVTTWPPHFPILGVGAEKFAEWVEEMSEGRLKIQVYGGGELIPPLEGFDAVSQGVAEMGHGAAYYWAGKAPATQFFAGLPFGMNAQQQNAWLYSGGGLALWEELYALFNLIPMAAGNTGVQMGGWFNREINSIDDFKGLKMRIPGLGGKVISRAGGSAVLSAGGEIYTNLERGVIDATEWIGPFHDKLMGFHKAAKYYYYPGWHEPGGLLELIINKSAFQSLPPDLQQIVRSAAARSNLWILSEFESQNHAALKELVDEHNVQLRRFPDEVIARLKTYTNEVIAELAASDPMSKKVYDSYSAFHKNVTGWAELSEKMYYSRISS
ncbi:MAG: TRAP transporter substrate-binding protein [Candidatus Latescibacterota bacterium]|nr:TRAP transporter substrate-binding protein [Candidatus Latescibacterota bacterium]